ncbi:hypothetical protein AX15_007523, partial [Amanita polypyramis BW_CC]
TSTRRKLLANLGCIAKHVAVIQGDFNLHLSLWDELCQSEKGVTGTTLYSTLLDNNFQLLNSDNEPTWYQEGNMPRVLDLVFANNDLGRQDLTEKLEIVDEKFDHRTIKLNLALGRCSTAGRPYIKGDSDEEFNFLDDILRATPYWTCLESAQDKMTHLMSSITMAFNKYAKMPNPNANPMMWWNDECNDYKDALVWSPTRANRASYYKAIKQTKKAYFGKKIEEMCESNRPWEGVRWTRDRPLSNIPRFVNNQGSSIMTSEELWPILNKQFNSGAINRTNINWDMINDLPSRQEC